MILFLISHLLITKTSLPSVHINITYIVQGPILSMCPKAPENLKGKVNISLEEKKMEDIEKDLGEIH